ncbi:MAG TPA: winged helix DNA-binding domain-containing protein [Nocardioides sp.]|nr:winged helix DNA-binding domain-containing protein [Nocardioides sp.]
MRLSKDVLNRTLLHRQHLLERVDSTPVAMAEHLIGLQAQDNLPPYLSLAARLTDFDPYDVTRGLEDKTLVRLLVMRGTIHLLTRDDALTLRQWTRPVHDREIKVSQTVGSAREIDRDAFDKAVTGLLADGPVPQKALGLALAEQFPGYTPTQLGQLARSTHALAQLPPRGTWKGSGQVVYQQVDAWVEGDLVEPDVPELVRRYLRAFGPASAADATAWSAVTGLAALMKGMDDLERHEDENGKVLYDLPGAPIADPDTPAPVRLFGYYDNVWLSHAGRDRVTDHEKRKAQQGPNGAAAAPILVDGWLEGLWRVDDGRVEIVSMLRKLTKAEQSELDEEIARVEAMLAL